VAAAVRLAVITVAFIVLWLYNSVSFRVVTVLDGMRLGVFFLVFGMAHMLYFRLRMADPGYLDTRHADVLNRKKDDEEDEEDDDAEKPDVANQSDYCPICQINRPLRSRHCRRCSRCVARFDHHCFWIGNCVGDRNHRTFFIYLVLEGIVVAWGVYDVCFSFVVVVVVVAIEVTRLPFPTQSFWSIRSYESWLPFVFYNAGLFAGMIYDFIVCPLFFFWSHIHLAVAWCTFGFSLFVYALLFYHVFLVVTNQTSWEHMRRSTVYLYFYPLISDAQIEFITSRKSPTVRWHFIEACLATLQSFSVRQGHPFQNCTTSKETDRATSKKPA